MENLTIEEINLCRERMQAVKLARRCNEAWTKMLRIAERMARDKHNELCIGGALGPCDCGAVEAAIAGLLIDQEKVKAAVVEFLRGEVEFLRGEKEGKDANVD